LSYELVLTAWLNDDSIFTIRTILNWLDGYGPVFNIGERVQAYTHPLWFLVLSLFLGISNSIYLAVFLVSLALSLATVAIVIGRISTSFLGGVFAMLALLGLLRIAREHQLDPLKEEVALALYEDTHWQAYITAEGYAKILNHHPAFDGIAFTQSDELINGIPQWMECTIYRKDRSQPIVVREYFEEVKGGQIIWQKMPRRMLRHKVMQQCARLAIC
jgi:hypothetical protein